MKLGTSISHSYILNPNCTTEYDVYNYDMNNTPPIHINVQLKRNTEKNNDLSLYINNMEQPRLLLIKDVLYRFNVDSYFPFCIYSRSKGLIRCANRGSFTIRLSEYMNDLFYTLDGNQNIQGEIKLLSNSLEKYN